MTQPAHRTGLIARKVGMTQVFREDGRRVSATLLHVDDCRVVGLRKPDKDGYTAVCLGAGSRKEKRVAKPQRVEYAKKDLVPAATVTEFRVKTEEALPPIGAALSPQHFAVGQFVDIAGVTKGRGFAGSMKRHGFGGGARQSRNFSRPPCPRLNRTAPRPRARLQEQEDGGAYGCASSHSPELRSACH